MEDYTKNGTISETLQVPLSAIYLKMVLLLIALFAVIRVIVKENQLHTKYYFFLFFLLVNDVMGVTLENSALFIALYIHVADINIPISCTALKILEAPSLASQLMFAVLAIDRYIAIKYPFRHRKMMTTKLASGLVIAV